MMEHKNDQEHVADMVSAQEAEESETCGCASGKGCTCTEEGSCNCGGSH